MKNRSAHLKNKEYKFIYQHIVKSSSNTWYIVSVNIVNIFVQEPNPNKMDYWRWCMTYLNGGSLSKILWGTFSGKNYFCTVIWTIYMYGGSWTFPPPPWVPTMTRLKFSGVSDIWAIQSVLYCKGENSSLELKL